MSGTFPSSPGFTATGFRSQNYNLSSTSLSGRTQVRALGSQRWEFTVQLPPMVKSEYRHIDAFIMKQRGMLESFQIVLPIISSKSGTASGTIKTNGAISIGATTFNATGHAGSLHTGDVIKFANHNKVYMITNDVTGHGPVNFEPPVMVAVPNDTTVVYDNVPFTVRMSNDVQEFNYALDGTVSYEIDMIEVI